MNRKPGPSHFIGEPIQAEFEGDPLLSKKPGCPAAFTWRGERYLITAMLEEWHDYGRRGRFAENMQEAHARAAERRGSWGVGRDYYRVQTSAGRGFLIYYDRAPKGAGDRQGHWFVREEIAG
jgi:Domain of unknown function (DUF6504)